MATIGSRQHFWTYLPELGPNYSYCERCHKVQPRDGSGFLSYKAALAAVREQKKAELAAQQEVPV